MADRSDSLVQAANEYFDALVKSRFIEMFGTESGFPQVALSEILKQHYVPEKIDHPEVETFITLSSYGKGIKKRVINEGKTPVAFVGCRIKEGQFVSSRLHAKEGAFGIVPAELDGSVVSRDFPVFNIDQNRVVPEFLITSVTQETFYSQFLNYSFGTTTKRRIKEDIFLDFKIVLPPLDEQKKFVSFLKQVYKSKLMFQQMISRYDELVKSRFIEMFKPFMNEGNLCMLEKLTNLFTDGNWIESKDQSQSGIRLIQTGNIGNAQYLDKAERSRFIDEETFVRLKCTEVVPGDVLVSRLPDPIGRSCIVPTDLGTMITGVDCTIIRFTDKINPVFFITYTLTDQYKSQIIEFEAGSTRKRISRKNLGKILVPVPPIELQNQFADFVKQVDKSKSEILEGIKRLNLPQNN